MKFFRSGNLPVGVQRHDWLGVAVLLATLNVSGNPAIQTDYKEYFLVGVALLFIAILLVKRQLVPDRGSATIFTVYVLIAALQCMALGFFPVITYVGFVTRLFIGYGTVRLARDFTKSYVQAMVLLAMLSLPFYLAHQVCRAIGIDLPGHCISLAISTDPYVGDWKSAAGVHTFFLLDERGASRNAGVFWEPGAFAGFLNLALVFLGLHGGRMERKTYVRQFLVLSTCLLTTFSTIGYLAYGAAVILHVPLLIPERLRDNAGAKAAIVLGLVGCLCAAGYVSWQAEFMGQKIERSVEVAVHQERNWEADRLGTILFDLEYIATRPLLGWGMHTDTRLALHPYLQEDDLGYKARGNGMSDFMARMGIPAFLLWVCLLYLALVVVSAGSAPRSLLGLLSIVVSLNGESYLQEPLFLGLAFLYFGGGKVQG